MSSQTSGESEGEGYCNKALACFSSVEERKIGHKRSSDVNGFKT